MKFKISYVYIIVIAAAIIGIILFNQPESSHKTEAEISNQQMPNDDVHKGLANEKSHSKMDVKDDAVQKMEKLKADYEKNPSDTAKIRVYADFLTVAHHQDEALELYKKIMKIDKKRTDILFVMAYINFGKQNINEAERITDQILSIDKNNLQAQYNVGAIAATRGNKEKAKQIWNKIIKENPNTETAEVAASSIKNL